jgi:hypothetical protein
VNKIDFRKICAGFLLKNSMVLALFITIFLGVGSVHALELVGLGHPIASGENITAIVTSESYDGQDLNGDGDARDRILTLHNITSGELISTGISVVGQLATDGTTVVFLYSERVDYVDLNGDGDARDNVLAYYHIPSAQLHTTPIEPYLSASSLPHYSVHQNIITFVSKEFSSREDFNGDLDQDDTVVRYWDMNTSQAYNTPLVSPYGMVDNGVIATRVIENSAIDVNADGDNDDIVFVTYDIASGQINPILATASFNLSNIASFPFKDGDNYFFRAREGQIGFDVDGDGSVGSYTNVIMKLNLANGSFDWTGVSGTYGRIQARGSNLTYETSESAVGQDINEDGNLQYDFLYALHNLDDNTAQYFAKSGTISLGSSVFSKTLYEGTNGEDLSGDGDTTDYVVFAQSLIDINNCGVDHIHCRFLNLINYLENHDDLTQAMKNLLIPFVEEADRVLTEVTHANDLEKYIAVIDAFDIYFDTIWQQDEIPYSLQVELVENHQNGRALKDHLHDLKDQAATDLEDQGQGNGNDSGNSEAQSLVAGMAVAVQGSSAPQALKDALMVEVVGIINVAQQIMGGADASSLIGILMNHIQAMRDILDGPNNISQADVDSISAAIDNFEAFMSGGGN